MDKKPGQQKNAASRFQGSRVRMTEFVQQLAEHPLSVSTEFSYRKVVSFLAARRNE
jgi:hypothetical protein